MKKTFKLTYLLAFALLLTTFGCSNDDEGTVPNVISVQDLEITIDENPTNGQIIGTVEATQTVGGETLEFSITSQIPLGGALSINENTGALMVENAVLFDFERNPIITAIISVEGAANTGAVTINLNNLNELNTQDFTVSIDENPTNGQVLGILQASGDGALSFSITSQTPAGAININTSGELSVADPNLFDFETNPIITANILVDNSGNTETLIATINLNDLDEVSAQMLNATIDENPINGDILGTIQATGGNLIFAITFQNPAGAFNINATTGELTIADATLFDFETNPNMLATVSVENSVNMVSVNAAISLNDVNEIGEFKYGGVIFWLNSTNNEGLVVSLNDQVNSSQWGCSSTVTGATGTAIGTGESNTATIVAAGCAMAGSAIEIISNLNLNGYNDWFLPSIDEWAEIDANLSIISPTIQANGGGNFSGNNWSSTEDSGSNAFRSFIGGGTISNIAFPKTNTGNARAIRSFTDF